MNQILFYAPNEPTYGCFSNFYRREVYIYGRTWPTSEHPFQAMKFIPHRPDLFNEIHEAPTPTRAAEIGRTRTNPITPEWDCLIQVRHNYGKVDDGRGEDWAIEKIKDVIMLEVVTAKFSQHEDLKQILLSTGNSGIIENAIHDPYWGWGSSMTGVNRLGKILIYVREALRSSK